MKKYLMLFLISIISLTVESNGKIFAQEKNLLIADFNSGEKPTNLGEDFGTWNKDANDASQSCQMSFVKDDALGNLKDRSLQLDYDVDSPNPAFNGFWLKISKAKLMDLDTLSFYIKGNSQKGFTKKIKVELKDKKTGKTTFFVESITDRWQKISLKIDKSSFQTNENKPFDEFVIVFDDVNSYPKIGSILIDQIEFSKS